MIELFEVVRKIKFTYPSNKVLWKAPKNNSLPPYKSVRLENKMLRSGLKKKCSSFPDKEKMVEGWYLLMRAPEKS